MSRADMVESLQDRIGHHFGDPSLLECALTHSSWANERGGPHNERMEFLGDAILDAVVARLLFVRFPRATEGMLSRMKHRLVQEVTLAAIGREMALGAVLRVGAGARKTHVQHKPAKLADTTEALIAALFLDVGFDRVVELVGPWFDPYFDKLTDERPKGTEAYKNPVSRLHELVARPPVRSKAHDLVLQLEGADHEREYRMAWWVGGRVLAEATGRSKKLALRAAAGPAIERLNALLAEGWRPDAAAEPPDQVGE